MQLNKDSDISNISQKTGFAIFELPEADFSQILPTAQSFPSERKRHLRKDDIEAISEITRQKKQDNNFILVLEEAEKMNEAAANTFLKTLEEPGE